MSIYSYDSKVTFENYLTNYKKFLSILHKNKFNFDLKDYVSFLIEDKDIYIHSFLVNNNLIDLSLYNKLNKGNFSILELALTTESELAEILEISFHKALQINIFAQFHYSNLFNGLHIYYAHPIDHYDESIEEYDLNIIIQYFPFADIINPSQLEIEWKKNNYSRSEILENCLEIVTFVDMVIFTPLDKHFISKGVFEEISHAHQQNIPVYVLYEENLFEYSLGEIHEHDWKKYCEYTLISSSNQITNTIIFLIY